MPPAGFMWECSCGKVEYSEVEPEECPKCGNLNTFVQMPEEIIEEREKDLADDFKEEALKVGKLPKTAKAKTSKSTKKKGRKK